MRFIRGLLLAGLAFGFLLPVSAQALSIPAIKIKVGALPEVDVAALAALVQDATNPDVYKWDLSSWANPLLQISGWHLELKEDPFVLNNISVLNPTTATQTFTFTVTLPITAFAYSQIVASSLGVTITDSITGPLPFYVAGASLKSVAPTAIYTGLINGAPALSLFPDPTTISCAATGCSTTQNAGPFNGPAAGVATSIGIQLKFDLKAGDSATITSRFEIVPEPGTLGLALSGLAGLGLLGRRRS